MCVMGAFLATSGMFLLKASTNYYNVHKSVSCTNSIELSIVKYLALVLCVCYNIGIKESLLKYMFRLPPELWL